MKKSCAVLCGMPCSLPMAERMFGALTKHSFAIEWVAGNICVSADRRVEAYMRDLPAAWHEMVNQLTGLGVRVVPDATRCDLADAFSQCDVTILVAHHVQTDDLVSIGIELSDGVLAGAEIAAISPTSSSAVVDLLGVCRSESFIPLVKARSGSARVIARKIRIDPIAQLRLIPQTLRAWRATDEDYVQTIANLHVAMLNELT